MATKKFVEPQPLTDEQVEFIRKESDRILAGLQDLNDRFKQKLAIDAINEILNKALRLSFELDHLLRDAYGALPDGLDQTEIELIILQIYRNVSLAMQEKIHPEGWPELMREEMIQTKEALADRVAIIESRLAENGIIFPEIDEEA